MRIAPMREWRRVRRVQCKRQRQRRRVRLCMPGRLCGHRVRERRGRVRGWAVHEWRLVLRFDICCRCCCRRLLLPVCAWLFRKHVLRRHCGVRFKPLHERCYLLGTCACRFHLRLRSGMEWHGVRAGQQRMRIGAVHEWRNLLHPCTRPLQLRLPSWLGRRRVSRRCQRVHVRTVPA